MFEFELTQQIIFAITSVMWKCSSRLSSDRYFCWEKLLQYWYVIEANNCNKIVTNYSGKSLPWKKFQSDSGTNSSNRSLPKVPQLLPNTCTHGWKFGGCLNQLPKIIQEQGRRKIFFPLLSICCIFSSL